MRMARVAGIVLIAAGTAVLVWGRAFTSNQRVLEIAGVVGALIAGVTLIVIDVRRNSGGRV